jgi:hypothetical protein
MLWEKVIPLVVFLSPMLVMVNFRRIRRTAGWNRIFPYIHIAMITIFLLMYIKGQEINAIAGVFIGVILFRISDSVDATVQRQNRNKRRG